ncbi:hypothetical protein GGF43_005513, partial [Coemansia sp. RSA 2618]
HATLAKRLETASAMSMKGAVLMTGGKMTTCELALVSNKLAFIAANCLAFQPNSTVLDTSHQYQVMVSDGGKNSVGTFSVESTQVHPKYDPATFANNIALMTFDGGNETLWKNYISVNPSDWKKEFYVKHPLTDNMEWDTPLVQESSAEAPADCAGASPVYAVNNRDFVCTDVVAAGASQDGKKCVTPYGTVYGVGDTNLAIAGIYSHSVVLGDDMCGDAVVYSYYTLLSNFLQWGGSVANSTIYLYADDTSYIINNNPGYSMNNPQGNATISGLLMGGDLNTDQGVHVGPSSSSEEEPSSTEASSSMSEEEPISDEPVSEEPTSEDPSSSSGASEETPKKKSNLTTIIIIAAAVVVVLLIVGIIVWRKCKKRQTPANYTTQHNGYNDGIGRQDYYDEY